MDKERDWRYPEWSEHYYKNGYYKVSKLERHPGLYRSGISVWDFQKKPDETPFGYSIHNDMCENFNRDHGLSILKVNPNY